MHYVVPCDSKKTEVPSNRASTQANRALSLHHRVHILQHNIQAGQRRLVARHARRPAEADGHPEVGHHLPGQRRAECEELRQRAAGRLPRPEHRLQRSQVRSAARHAGRHVRQQRPRHAAAGRQHAGDRDPVRKERPLRGDQGFREEPWLAVHVGQCK